MPRVGFSGLRYALLTADTSSALTYGEPVLMPQAIELKITRNSQTAKNYADDGVAAVLQFPGVLYRGGRERVLREWLVSENLLDRVIAIPGDTFTDTAIGTACLVLRKDREPGAPIVFENREHGVTAEATLSDIEGEDWSLSVHLYAHEPEPVREPVDAWLLEQASRATACIRLRHELNFSRTIAELEGWEFTPFLDDLVAVISEFQEDAA